MKLSETIKTAFTALNSNKLRSALTMLGVIIGVFSVVTLIALGEGIQNYVKDQFDELGSNLVFVLPGSGDFAGDPAQSFTRNQLQKKHVELIESRAEDFVENVTPYYVVGEVMSFKTKTYLADIVGVSAEAQDFLRYEISKGRKFTSNEQRNGEKVAIIGPELSKELFGVSNPIGQRVKIRDDSYEIIGTFKSRGSDYDTQAVVPYKAIEKSLDLTTFSYIIVETNPDISIEASIRQIEIALLSDLKVDEFEVSSQKELLNSVTQILRVLTIGLGAIAAISLIVGGIGIMNIMLVAVTERIREIGLRKALGARPVDLAFQFLTESVILSTIGGLIGLAFAAIATIFAQNFLRAEIPLFAVFLAFGFSFIVGVIFGTYPAISAAKKDPIEALRYE